MPVVRNILVVASDVWPSALDMFSKNGISPLKVLELPEAVLAVAIGRVQFDRDFFQGKLPLKKFRTLWLDDEGGFARTGNLQDNWFSTQFVAHEELRIPGEEMDRLQAAFAKDEFLSLSVEKAKALSAAKKSAKLYSRSFARFQEFATLEDENDGVRSYLAKAPIPKTDDEEFTNDWERLIADGIAYQSSLGAHFAMDMNSWWDVNQRGEVNCPEEGDLACHLTANFAEGDQYGQISDYDSQVDGYSLE